MPKWSDETLWGTYSFLSTGRYKHILKSSASKIKTDPLKENPKFKIKEIKCVKKETFTHLCPAYGKEYDVNDPQCISCDVVQSCVPLYEKFKAEQAELKTNEARNRALSCFGHRLSQANGKMDELFCQGTFTIDEIADRVGVKRATVMAHLSTLRKLGVKISYNEQKQVVATREMATVNLPKE